MEKYSARDLQGRVSQIWWCDVWHFTKQDMHRNSQQWAPSQQLWEPSPGTWPPRCKSHGKDTGWSSSSLADELCQWIGLRENLQETHGFSYEWLLFPVIFPLNQSNEPGAHMYRNLSVSNANQYNLSSSIEFRRWIARKKWPPWLGRSVILKAMIPLLNFPQSSTCVSCHNHVEKQCSKT